VKPRLPPAPWTDEDKAVISFRLHYQGTTGCFEALSTIIQADQRDAEKMSGREDMKHRTPENFADWSRHRREWFPSKWGSALYGDDGGDWEWQNPSTPV
jgi:hypothetical protein